MAWIRCSRRGRSPSMTSSPMRSTGPKRALAPAPLSGSPLGIVADVGIVPIVAYLPRAAVGRSTASARGRDPRRARRPAPCSSFHEFGAAGPPSRAGPAVDKVSTKDRPSSRRATAVSSHFKFRPGRVCLRYSSMSRSGPASRATRRASHRRPALVRRGPILPRNFKRWRQRQARHFRSIIPIAFRSSRDGHSKRAVEDRSEKQVGATRSDGNPSGSRRVRSPNRGVSSGDLRSDRYFTPVRFAIASSISLLRPAAGAVPLRRLDQDRAVELRVRQPVAVDVLQPVHGVVQEVVVRVADPDVDLPARELRPERPSSSSPAPASGRTSSSARARTCRSRRSCRPRAARAGRPSPSGRRRVPARPVAAAEFPLPAAAEHASPAGTRAARWRSCRRRWCACRAGRSRSGSRRRSSRCRCRSVRSARKSTESGHCDQQPLKKSG